MLPNIIKKCPILSNFAQYCQILPIIVNCCHILSNITQYFLFCSKLLKWLFQLTLIRKEQSHIVQNCPIYPNIVWYRLIMYSIDHYCPVAPCFNKGKPQSLQVWLRQSKISAIYKFTKMQVCRYTTMQVCNNSESYAVIFSQTSHFVIFKTKHWIQ